MHKFHANSFVISGVVGENLEFLFIVAWNQAGEKTWILKCNLELFRRKQVQSNSSNLLEKVNQWSYQIYR